MALGKRYWLSADCQGHSKERWNGHKALVAGLSPFILYSCALETWHKYITLSMSTMLVGAPPETCPKARIQAIHLFGRCKKHW
jgi:hypothetical protein